MSGLLVKHGRVANAYVSDRMEENADARENLQGTGHVVRDDLMSGYVATPARKRVPTFDFTLSMKIVPGNNIKC